MASGTQSGRDMAAGLVRAVAGAAAPPRSLAPALRLAILLQILNVILQNRHALCHCNIIVAQVRDDDRKAKKHEQKYAADKEEQGQRRVGEAAPAADRLQRAITARQ